jgi:hypothetical protein
MKEWISYPGRGTASFRRSKHRPVTMHRGAGARVRFARPWTSDQQRTTPQVRRAAQRPENVDFIERV